MFLVPQRRWGVLEASGGQESLKSRPTTLEPDPGLVAEGTAVVPGEWEGVVSASGRGLGLLQSASSFLMMRVSRRIACAALSSWVGEGMDAA